MCSRAEIEKAHCCLYDFPLSSETHSSGGEGRAGLSDNIRDRDVRAPAMGLGRVSFLSRF